MARTRRGARTTATRRTTRATAVVLHEDANPYPSAADVYGAAETLVQDEDTQPITQPLLAPREVRTFAAEEEAPPALVYDDAFLAALLAAPARARLVAVLGALHAGKTTLCDALIEATRVEPFVAPPRYTDALRAEAERGVSLKATPFSVALRAGAPGAPSVAYTFIDAPGHAAFSDEATAAVRCADGVLLVVDAVEGVVAGTERALRAAAAARAPLVVCIAKVDRLILDLRLPPADAYFKLAAVVAEVNAAAAAAAAAAGAPVPRALTPADGSVVFAGAAHAWTFSLRSWARASAARWRGAAAAVDADALAARLWGDTWYNAETRRFSRAPPRAGAPRAFVTFVLEPLWKVYATAVGEDARAIAALAAELRVPLRAAEAAGDVRPVLRALLRGLLGGADGLAEALAAHVPSPAAAAPALVAALYTGDADAPEARALAAADRAGPLMAHVVKLVPKPEGGGFLALTRVLSGELLVGARVRVLGEAYSADDGEDAQLATVRAIALGQARFRVPLAAAAPGMLVLVDGLGDAVAKTATLTGVGAGAADAGALRPLRFDAEPCVRVAVEPLNPSELPKVLAGLRALTQSYPLARTRVEESGEHVLMGAGELALDCMLRDLRDEFARVEVKVADPVVSFCETAAEQSSAHAFARTPNRLNKLTFCAQPLDRGLAEDIAAGAVPPLAERKRAAAFFEAKYGWDVLAARGAWAFGPAADRGPNVLLDDTLPAVGGAAGARALAAARDAIVQGFQWAAREGPLCDEPLRGVKLRLVGAELAADALQRGGGQVIPTVRRAAYAAMLLAAPRLLEPVFAVEVLAPADALPAVAAVLARRRGHVVSEAPRPGTPLFCVRGFIPVMDSFGFETDLRVFTQGAAAAATTFDHWALVPGDPLDKSIVLRPLEASPPAALARDFMVKTRRRKGLAEDVAAAKCGRRGGARAAARAGCRNRSLPPRPHSPRRAGFSTPRCSRPSRRPRTRPPPPTCGSRRHNFMRRQPLNKLKRWRRPRAARRAERRPARP